MQAGPWRYGSASSPPSNLTGREESAGFCAGRTPEPATTRCPGARSFRDSRAGDDLRPPAKLERQAGHQDGHERGELSHGGDLRSERNRREREGRGAKPPAQRANSKGAAKERIPHEEASDATRQRERACERELLTGVADPALSAEARAMIPNRISRCKW